MNRIEIYTDGACVPNPGVGGWGIVILKDGELIKESYGAEDNTTNNRMEIQAVIEALKYSNECTIYSDSAYVVSCMIEKWYKRWQNNNWKRKEKGDLQDVKNRDLWEELIGLLGNKTWFEKVKGHSGNKWNDRADELSIIAIEEQTENAVNKLMQTEGYR